MTRMQVSTSGAPAPGGAYSQGISAGPVVATAGQVGIDPATGVMADGIERQTELALRNVGAVLEAAGVSWADVVKTTCYLTDIANFERFNRVYADFVPDPKPARSTVGVRLGGSALVEIEALAVRVDP
jgi:2-iminobutanoate/2-iminopropanoate deaminase